MKRQKFSLSHYKLFTADMGELIPAACIEVLPGDTIQQATSALIRVSPLLAPVMHPVHVRIHHWYVPMRLIWEDFEKFITGGPDGNDASVPPTITATPSAGSLHDYFGLPLGNSIAFSALPFRAYNLIHNEFYRDQDLQTARVLSTASGADTTTDVTLAKVNWEKDYFTSARPWPQKGDEVTIPFAEAGTLPVLGIGKENNSWGTGINGVYESNGAQANYASARPMDGVAGNYTWWAEQNGTTGYPNVRVDVNNVGLNITDLRQAMALQKFAEARARYGSRYTEYLRYLGIRSADSRLQRPEYLGGGKETIQFSEVLQSGPDSTDEGVANLKGHGIGAMRSNRYRRFFDEHGYIITTFSVKPKTMYCQGLHRSWTRATKEDFFQRELQHIGQQEILNKEIYAAHSTPAGVFGYQDRYDEYRRMESGVSGDFRDTLDHWHMSRIFTGDTTLNSDFVTSTPTKRIHAVSTNDVLWVMANNSIQARRMLASRG